MNGIYLYFVNKHLSSWPLLGLEATDSGERGMNPVAMTIINPRKNIGRAGDRTSDLMFSSPLRYQQNYGARLNKKKTVHVSDRFHWSKSFYRICSLGNDRKIRKIIKYCY